MTEQELQELATRENVTLRADERKGRIYWQAFGRHQGDLHSVYLCADSRLNSFSEGDFLRKVRGLPGRSGTERMSMHKLPGQTLRVGKGKRVLVLTYDEVKELARVVGGQDEESYR
jgi:hypothetical protein